MKKLEIIKGKRLLVLLLAIVMAFTLAACGSEDADTDTKDTGDATSSEGGELRYGITVEPETFDPILAQSADTRSLLFNLFEGLVKVDTNGDPQPAVAENVVANPTGTTYTFTIRKGVKFHNGNEVTAEDITYSLETAKAAEYAGFDNIDKIEADGDTITISLIEADVEFLPFLTTAIIPKDYADQATKPIGTGPFKFESYSPQKDLVFVKNEDYWQEDLPHLDKVTVVFQADYAALLLALQSGNIDSTDIGYDVAQQLNKEDYNDFVDKYSNSVQLLALNNKVEPLNDLKVRQALNYAIDSQEIIDKAFFGKGKIVGTPVIPGLTRYYDSSLESAYQPDVEKAKALLAEAGYADGFDLEITLANNYTDHINTSEVIINQLAAIGVKATVKEVDWATWLDDVYFGRNFETTIISVDGPTVSPRSFLSRYDTNAGDNFVNFSNPEYDKVYGEGTKEADVDKRTELYNQAQQILSDDAASVYIQDIVAVNVLRKGFAGAVTYPLFVTDFATIYKTA
jgi:peptide/nickel transport system substrate-binding protein